MKPRGKNRDLTHSRLLVVCINIIPTILGRHLDLTANGFKSKIVGQGMWGGMVPIAGRDLANAKA